MVRDRREMPWRRTKPAGRAHSRSGESSWPSPTRSQLCASPDDPRLDALLEVAAEMIGVVVETLDRHERSNAPASY
jgi:hypothetical protein